MLLISYLQLLFPKGSLDPGVLVLFIAAFMLGIIFVSEGITWRLKRQSLISEIRRSRQNLISFLAVSTAGGLLFEGIVKWLGKLVIYPYLDMPIYLVIFIPGFALYWLMVLESYLAVKTTVDFLHNGRKTIGAYLKFEPLLYKLLGIAGVSLILMSILFVVQDYASYSQNTIISIQDLGAQTINYKIAFFHVFILFLGMWLILEFIEYARKKTSLLKDIIHSYFSPLVSILVGSFLVAIFMESQNVLHGYWMYIDIPFEEFEFFGLSPLVLMMGWPVHYIYFLSLFRAFTGKESDEIWRGDRIP